MDGRTRLDLLVRTAGALPHALWVLCAEWRLDMVLQDLKYALRAAVKRPGWTSLVVLTLALGIGANSVMFSIVNSVLIKPLPYERPEELVYIFGAFKGGDQASVSPPDFLDYRERNTVFASLAARTIFGSAVLNGGPEDEPERVTASTATANIFATLGVRPFLGRGFLPEEERGRHDVVVLSHGVWQRRFGADPGIVGATTRVDGRPHTVVGVMPPVLDRTLNVQLWRPVPFGTEETSVRRFHWLRGVGRLKPGVTLERAQGEMDVIARQLEQAYPENESWKLRLVPYSESVVGDVGRALLLLFGAVGLVLLIACGNAASLLLARATARGGEIAVRTALGASRTRLVRQLLTETLLLGLGAGAAGLALASLLLRGVRAVGEGILPRLAEIELDGAALAFTLALSLVTSLVFGLVPAVSATRQGIAAMVKALATSSAARGRVRLRDALVVGQVALSMVLLIGAGLLIRSLWQLQRVEPGFDPARLLTAQVSLSPEEYRTRAQIEQFWESFLERARAIRGVEAAATSVLPLRGGGDTYFYVEGRPPATDADRLNAVVSIATDDYFSAMRIPLVAGRAFTSADRGGAGVVIINRSLAERLFPGRSALGARLVVDFGQPFVAEIVGVAGDARVYGQSNEAPEIMYFSHRQEGAGWGVGYMSIVVRTRGDPASVAPQLRAALRELEPDVPLASVETMEEILDGSVSQERFRARLLAGFAAAALVLAVVGLYGVLAYSVTQRRRELGIRIALGARGAEVFALVVRQGMALVALGIALGLAASFAAMRLLSNLLFEVGPTDAAVFTLVPLALALAGLAACVVPARRATKVSPMVALREG